MGMSESSETAELHLRSTSAMERRDVITDARLLAATLAISIAGLLLLGIWIQQQVHLNHDVGWIVHSARWMLEGRRFGSDIVDPNPPLIWFLSLPAAALVKAGWLPEPGAIRLYIWLLCLGSLALSHRVLTPLWRARKHWEAAALVLGIAFTVSVLAGRSFGQREFLAFALGMPLCLLIAGRMQYGATYSRPIAIVCGLAAGVAFSLKPWLIAVPLLVEAVYWSGHRNWRRIWRAETLALAGFMIAYAVVAIVFTPDYFTVTLPLVRAVYWVYGHGDATVMWETLRAALLPAVVAALALLASRTFSAYPRVLFAALVGYAFNYWMQQKGFDYHLYPVMATAVVLLIYSCVPAWHGLMNMNHVRSGFKFAGVAVLLLIVAVQLSGPTLQVRRWYLENDIQTGSLGQLRQALIERVRRLAGNGGKRVYTFSTHPFPAFPTINYLNNVESASSILAQFAVSAYIRRDLIEDAVIRKRVDWGVERQRQIAVDDFLKNDPDIVLVNTGAPGAFDYISYFSSDARFAQRWRNYREANVSGGGASGGIRIFVRQ